jgi:hypothetical protein
VGVLRAGVGADLSDPRLVELVTELSAASERFRVLWSRHDVQVKHSRVHHLTHPVVGELNLRSHKLVINGTDGLMLAVMHATPGSPDAARLARLQLVASPAGG